MAAMKSDLMKMRVHYYNYNVNVVQGRSYKNLSAQKFVIRKFHYMKISRSMVVI